MRDHTGNYVLVHELAHLREPHHGPAVWELLGRAVPDYEERKTQLARIGQACGSGRLTRSALCSLAR